MLKRRSPNSVHIVTVLLLCLCSPAVSQSNKKPKLKDFGSSLKRLKWDEKQNATVETKRRDGKSARTHDDVVRVETTLVVSDVLVLDPRGQSVSGLTANDFVVTEDAQPQQVGMFSLGDNAVVPRSIVLIIDYSGSQFPFIKASVAAAKTLVDKLTPNDRMAIVNDDVELLQDFTNNKQQLRDKLDRLLNRVNPAMLDVSPVHKYGRSQQYSALMATLKEAFVGEDERPIIIFQTDGDQLPFLRHPLFVPSRLYHEGGGDEAELDRKRIERLIASQRTEFSLNDVIRAAEKSRATIYSIVPGFEVLGRSPEDQIKQIRADLEQRLAGGGIDAKERRHQIDKLLTPAMLRYAVEGFSKTQFALTAVSTASGGWTAFLETPSQADTIYSHISSDINSRYIVGYYPTNKGHDGKRRRLNVLVRDHPEYTVISRKAYYAQDPDQ